MAKKQRGKTLWSSKSSVSEKETDLFGSILPSSDDEAPEEVTFEDSKAQALRSMKRALDSARREKEQLKEKRRKRQELFQEQKKRKLLPAEMLEEIASAPSQKQAQSGDEDKDEVEDESSKRKTERRRKNQAHSRKICGGYVVTTVEGRGSACVQQKAAEDFIHSRLYGPGSRRTTTNELLSLQNKKGRNKNAAVQFVKKNWACKQKAKAEKLKKRWLSQQQIPSS